MINMQKSKIDDKLSVQRKFWKKRQRNLPKSLRTQYKVQKNINLGENQKVFRIDHDELIVKNCPEKNKQLFNNLSLKKSPNCSSCKWNIWLELDKVWYCRVYECIINNQKHRID